MWTAGQTLTWLYEEFGISSLYHTGRDAWLIILARTCRMFAFGAASLIIALFFSELRFTDFQIGLFMTLTLAGDVVLSLGLTVVADSVGRRRVLILGGVIMALSGAIFAIFENFWILLLAAVVGVISASGGDFGPFRSIEESALSQITTSKTRSDVLMWYVATSSLGSAAGTELSGRLVEFFRSFLDWEVKDAYHGVFWLYVTMGLMSLLSATLLSDKCELESETAKTEASETLLGATEDAESHDTAGNSSQKPTAPKKSRFAQISSATRSIMYKLWFLLFVDSLADGMASYSLTNYYIDRKFGVSKATLGDIMSIAYFLTVPSTIFAGPLAKRIGLVNTMVFTHLPSSLAVLFFPVGNSLVLSIVLLYIRTGLNNMDQAPRSAFIAAAVRPEERTAVMGITGTVRTLGSTVGPSLTGSLAENDLFWIAFVVAGLCRVAYDLGLFAIFRRFKVEEDEPGHISRNERHPDGEDDYVELESVHERDSNIEALGK